MCAQISSSINLCVAVAVKLCHPKMECPPKVPHEKVRLKCVQLHGRPAGR